MIEANIKIRVSIRMRVEVKAPMQVRVEVRVEVRVSPGPGTLGIPAGLFTTRISGVSYIVTSPRGTLCVGSLM